MDPKFLNKIIITIGENKTLLLLFLFGILAVFLILVAATGNTLIFANNHVLDNLGRVFSGLTGVAILTVSLFSLNSFIQTANTISRDESNSKNDDATSTALRESIRKEVHQEISRSLVTLEKSFRDRHQSASRVELFSFYNQQGVIFDEDYQGWLQEHIKDQ